MQKSDGEKWWIAVFSFTGFCLSCYLFWARLANHEVVCVTSALCDLVLKSDYSIIAGIPVTFLGLLAYCFLLIITLARGRVMKNRDTNMRLAVYGISLTGFLYSAYLTYIQKFVLRSMCIWCLTSMVLMTIIFIIAVLDIWAGLTSARK